VGFNHILSKDVASEKEIMVLLEPIDEPSKPTPSTMLS
jgi:hypothetical protein